jgi:hypothetical protein
LLVAFPHAISPRTKTFLLSLAGTFWVAEICEPRAAVELSIGRLDLALRVDLKNVDTLDLFTVVAGTADRDPTPGDLGAAVEGIESLKKEWGLCTGSGDEGLFACEGDGSFL